MHTTNYYVYISNECVVKWHVVLYSPTFSYETTFSPNHYFKRRKTFTIMMEKHDDLSFSQAKSIHIMGHVASTCLCSALIMCTYLILTTSAKLSTSVIKRTPGKSWKVHSAVFLTSTSESVSPLTNNESLRNYYSPKTLRRQNNGIKCGIMFGIVVPESKMSRTKNPRKLHSLIILFLQI